MSATNDLFGWDLLYKTIEGNVTREADVIIALAHWFLIRNVSFRCVGVGDDKTLSDTDSPTELLPDGWNDSGDSYALRYIFDKNLYILLGAKTEGTLVINLLDVKSRDVSNLALSPTEVVKSLKGPLKTMVPNVTDLLERFKRELTDPVFSGTTKEVTTQTQGESSRQSQDGPFRSPLYGVPLPGNPLVIPSSISAPGARDPLRDIGRGDLDPLGRGGGGMIFPGPGIPSFGVPDPSRFFNRPPGARFDPFGPIDPDRRQNQNYPGPNPDHFRPPSDFDDMYM